MTENRSLTNQADGRVTSTAARRESLELSTEFAQPVTDTEQRLAVIYAEIFGVDRVGLDDDFFELGGDSHSAVTLAAELDAAFGLDVKPSRLAEVNTVRKMARRIDEPGSKQETLLPSNVAGLNLGGPRPPIFMIHGNAGITFLSRDFLAGLHPDQPVYIFQAPGFDGAVEPIDNVPDLAITYMRTILEISPTGPWTLTAFCGGAWIAVEMIHQMALEGLRPTNVVLIDPIIQKALKDDFRARRLSRIGPPAVGRALVWTSDRLIATASRSYFFARTGVWADPRSPEAMETPGMKEMRSRQLRTGLRQMRKRLEKRLRSRDTETATESRRRMEIKTRDSAILTGIVLKHALRNYRPKATDFPAIVIGSSPLKRHMKDPDHPINRLLPNHVFKLSGQKHHEAVRSTGTARFIQEVAGETAAAAGTQ